MTGTTFKRTKFNWGYSIDLGASPEGKRLRSFKSGFRTKGEADNARTEKLREIQDRAAVDHGQPQTLGQLITVYLTDHAEKRCTPLTVQRYRALVQHLDSGVLATPLQQLTTLGLEREFNRLKDSGGHQRHTGKVRPLAAKTVRHIWGVISASLNNGIRLGIMQTNPASQVHLPPLDQKESRALDATQTDLYFSAAKGHYMYPVLVLAAATGCRRGELLALKWSDFDEARALLAITKAIEQTLVGGLRIKSTKNRKERSVMLPQIAVEMLRSHQQEQGINRQEFGADYRADLDLILALPDGNYLRPDTVTASACLLAAKAGFDGVSLHSLRHSHGSQLLSKGVPMAVVSKRLGHSSPRITAEIYAHALPEDEAAAAAIWDAQMRPAMTPQNPATGRMVANGCNNKAK